MGGRSGLVSRCCMLTTALRFAAELLEVLEEAEAALGIQPDADIHSYMSALAASGKKSLAVDIMLRTLGLEQCADTLVRTGSGEWGARRAGIQAWPWSAYTRLQGTCLCAHACPPPPPRPPRRWATTCCAASAAGRRSV